MASPLPAAAGVSTADAPDSVIAVVGAGLAGSMMALMLVKRGFRVHLFEKRPDFRIAEREEAYAEKHFGQSRDPTKRSINLALSIRGQSALRAVGLEDEVLANCIPMPCRAIHALDGKITKQAYGTSKDAIYSASRSLLNSKLLDACDAYSSLVTMYFEHAFKSVDEAGNIVVENVRTKTNVSMRVTAVFGADGAYSAVRTAMLRVSRMDFARTYINHGYKELNMPPVNGTFALPSANALHIWPRHDFMMIALPNPDYTFTCTLFLPWEKLDALDADVSLVRPFFEKYFPDALPLIPQLEEQFTTHPSSALVMTSCNPWNLGNKAVLIGDAAHSTVPFYGQGANCAFEDCLAFVETLDACGNDVATALTRFAKERKPAGDALCYLSLKNYVEMRDKTASSAFLLRKKLEAALHWLMPHTWIPQYSMVSFTRIPYDEVVVRAERQDRILDWTFRSAAVAAAGGLAFAAVKYGLPAWQRYRK